MRVDVERSASHRSLRLQPAAVHAHRDAEVARDGEALAEDLDVGRRVGAHGVEVDATVELRLVLGHERGVEAAHVVVLLAPREPRDGGVARAVDRSVDDLAGGDVHDPDDRLLRAALGDLVGEEVALLARLPRVEGGEPGGVERHGVEEHALGAVGVDGAQHGELLAGVAAHEEPPVAAERRGADRPGTGELVDARPEVLDRVPLRAVGVEQDRLLHRPGSSPLGIAVRGVLEPAVGVGHEASVQVVDDVVAGSIGVRRHAVTLGVRRSRDPQGV